MIDMLIDTMDKKIKEMKDLRLREERRDNKAAQDVLDLKFKNLTERITLMMLALQYSKKNMSFRLNDVDLDTIAELLTSHKAAIQSGYADKDAVSKVEMDLKGIENSIRKEWTKHYSSLTSSTVSTLKVIADIDEDKVSDCLEGIGCGATWTTDLNEFQEMNKGLSDANTLISGLGLDDQIIQFLQKMNNGKATVVDLDEKVMSWLKTEALEKKVKLSFR